MLRLARFGRALLLLLGIYWRSGGGSDGLGRERATNNAERADKASAGSLLHRAATKDARLHVFFNGSIWTADEQKPTASILAVQHGIIRAVGSSLDQVLMQAVQDQAQTQEREQEQEGQQLQHGAAAGTTAPAPTPTTAAVAASGDGQEVVLHDLQGRFVMPGFVDAHTHIIPGGLALMRVQLRAVRSRADWEARVAAAAASLAPGEWVLGGLWDESEWGGQLPGREWLDQVCGGRPAYVTRHDSHLGVANSAALARAGITAATPDPDGGTIDRDPATGEPTGILRERAMQLVAAVIPEPSVATRRAALAAAAALALSRGVTSVVDMGRYPFSDEGSSWRDLQEVYLPAAESGELPLRLVANVPLSSWDRLHAWVAHRAAQQRPAHQRGSSVGGSSSSSSSTSTSPLQDASGRLFWGGLKEFVDGSLGSHTALLWQPYADDPAYFGTRMLPDTRLRQLLRQAVAAGFRVSLHAIGDRAVDEVAAACADALAAAAEPQAHVQGAAPVAVVPGARFAIEHVQHISGPNTSTALARVAHGGEGVTDLLPHHAHLLQPVLNPLHLLTDGDMLLPRLGQERAAPDRSFPFGALLEAGLRPAMASDWPVVDLQPMTSIYAALHRAAPPAAAAADLNARLPPGQRMDVVGLEDAAAEHHHAHQVQEQEQTQGAQPQRAKSADGTVSKAEGHNIQFTASVNVSPGDHHHHQPQQQQQQQVPERRVSLDEALRGHTSWAAEAAGLQGQVGRLAVGLRADFIELDLSPEAMMPASDSQQRQPDGAPGAALHQLRAMLLGCQRGEAGSTGSVAWSSGDGGGVGQGDVRLPAVLRTWLDGALVYDQQQQQQQQQQMMPSHVGAHQESAQGDGSFERPDVWQVV
ncbi:hypothetical protein HYH02_007163 [Chlamydomonas schloesseri]|uniref:Amidohydrolase 3 domain-containing protein n=1 Tax=Chlamydomonas schloesseri TaxID=2026947 RepID=A0A835WHM6_9CHLO|nr:hypothetical protein HYH02_007163 [Chlamydomonas schloesseri]|eukprot:KAG2447703.1 hypothetical protein HYH02_007163 [Chlamydomonas schloesseri]